MHDANGKAYFEDETDIKTELPPVEYDKDDSLEDAKNVMRRVTVENDDNRVNAATNLVNTFNFAVQVQANRAKWQPSDYRAFAVALIAIDSIGRTDTVDDTNLQPGQTFQPSVEDDIRDTLKGARNDFDKYGMFKRGN